MFLQELDKVAEIFQSWSFLNSRLIIGMSKDETNRKSVKLLRKYVIWRSVYYFFLYIKIIHKFLDVCQKLTASNLFKANFTTLLKLETFRTFKFWFYLYLI